MALTTRDLPALELPEGYVDLEYASAYLNTTKDAVRQLVYADKLAGARLLGHLLIRRDSLDDYRRDPRGRKPFAAKKIVRGQKEEKER